MGHRGRASGARWAAVVVLLSATWLSAACGDPGTDDADPGCPVDGFSPAAQLVGVDEAALQGPGTPLGPGVEVAAGSHLVGTVFPYRDAGATGPGWQATLLVTGDPLAVWADVADQLGLSKATAVRSCVVRTVAAGGPPDDGSFPARLLTEEALDGENQLRCSAHVGDTELDMDVGATLRCQGVEIRCELRPVANLLIRHRGSPPQYEVSDRYGATEVLFERDAREPRDPAAPKQECGIPCSEDSDALDGPVIAPDLDLADLQPSDLPGPGEPIDDGIDPFGLKEFLVPDGGRSLVAPALLIRCNSGLVAVLDLPGSPDDVAQTLDRASGWDDPISTVPGDMGQRRTITGLISTAGGYYVAVDAVEAGSGRTTALITECGD